jgi:hypothetical protein
MVQSALRVAAAGSAAQLEVAEAGMFAPRRSRVTPLGLEKSNCLSERVCSKLLAPVVPDDGDEEVGSFRLGARFAAVKVGPDEMTGADERSIWRE